MTSAAAPAEAALADLAGLRARHPAVFLPDWPRRLRAASIVGALAGLFLYGLYALEFSAARVFGGLGQLAWIVSFMVPPEWGTTDRLLLYVNAMGETLAIACLGTLGAAALAFPLSFMAARNTTLHWFVRLLTRRSSDVLRAVDALIWALIWVSVVGLGPFAGVLAIMTSDIGSFVKLFSEAIETADARPVEGVVSSGGNRWAVTRLAVVPQVLPVIAAQVLYFFESNTRSSTIIGIVGAGGIGLHLTEEIRTIEWRHVSLLVLMILIVVAVIGWVSARLREGLTGRRLA